MAEPVAPSLPRADAGRAVLAELLTDVRSVVVDTVGSGGGRCPGAGLYLVLILQLVGRELGIRALIPEDETVTDSTSWPR